MVKFVSKQDQKTHNITPPDEDGNFIKLEKKNMALLSTQAGGRSTALRGQGG